MFGEIRLDCLVDCKYILVGLICSRIDFFSKRDIDAAGAIQTPEIIMLNILVLALPFLIPLLIQIGWLVAMLVIKNKRKQNEQYS